MFQPLSQAVRPTLCLYQHFNPPINSLFTAIRDRLRVPDDQNQHDQITLDFRTSAQGYLECRFENPIDGKSYKMVVYEYENDGGDDGSDVA